MSTFKKGESNGSSQRFVPTHTAEFKATVTFGNYTNKNGQVSAKAILPIGVLKDKTTGILFRPHSQVGNDGSLMLGTESITEV